MIYFITKTERLKETKTMQEQKKKRIKKVFDSRQLCHVWASETQSEGRNSGRSMFFENNTIYSYGRHYTLGVIHTNKRGEKLGLINSERYSVTTSKHRSQAASALYGRMNVLHVPRPNDLMSETNEIYLTNAVASYVEEIFNSRKHCSEYTKEGMLDSIKDLNILLKFKGKKEFSLDAETMTVIDEILVEKIEQNKARDAARSEKRKAQFAEYKRQQELKRQDYLSSVMLWPTFQNTKSIPSQYFPHDMIRVNKLTLEVETSRGAKVPLDEALKAFQDLESGIDVIGRRVGSFTIDEVTQDKIVVGCHELDRAQVRKILSEGL
jgi:hypothetical protein